MAIQIQGNAGTVADVQATNRAINVCAFPQDPSTLGYYALMVDNGTTVMTAGLAANAPIFAARWGNANLCMLRSVKFGMVTTAAFVTGRIAIDLFIARGFTASDTLGTVIVLTGNNNKKRTSFGTSLFTDMRISATAALTAGTRTLDANPIGKMLSENLTANANIPAGQPYTTLWQRDSSDEYPLVLAQNEGLVIQATVPGTGTWFFAVGLEWFEVASF